jgi:hypothetical protein
VIKKPRAICLTRGLDCSLGQAEGVDRACSELMVLSSDPKAEAIVRKI